MRLVRRRAEHSDEGERGGQMKVHEIMSADPITIAPTASLQEAAALLVEHRISGVPVVHGGSLVGVFSERDLMFKERGRPEVPPWLARFTNPIAAADRPKLDAKCVGAAMTSPAITIEGWESVSSAASRMLETGVSRLPVIRVGELVGIVTRADLVRAFLRTDEEIASEIREEVVDRALWIDDATVDVLVEHGEVTLKGETAVAFDRDVVERLVARVPGVVSVTTDVALV
jgi:CBS domain-containing protein